MAKNAPLALGDPALPSPAEKGRRVGDRRGAKSSERALIGPPTVGLKRRWHTIYHFPQGNNISN